MSSKNNENESYHSCLRFSMPNLHENVSHILSLIFNLLRISHQFFADGVILVAEAKLVISTYRKLLAEL